MKAKIINGTTISGNRSLLYDIIPLDMPFLIQVFPFYGCNFKCNYCIHSVDENKRGFISDSKYLEFDLYKKFIDDLKEFNTNLKMLRFAGTGEPLLHKNISEMVLYARQSNIVDTIDIVTNAEYLDKELSDKLIESGLSTLRISIQGLDEASYLKTSGKRINYKNLIKNIEYFYRNKKDDTKVYIKIIDCALDKKEELFYQTFGDICDYIAIEHMLPATDLIDYSNITNSSFKLTQNGNDVLNAKVCPQPFYMIQLNPDGNIVPCCSMETAFVIGNIKDKSVYSMWHSKELREFRKKQLNFKKHEYKVCSKCKQYKFAMFKEDYLDDKVDIIKEKYFYE